MPVTRESIELTLRELNNAENSDSMSAEEKSAVVDRLSAADVHGWANGADRGGRDAERQFEAFLWTSFPTTTGSSRQYWSTHRGLQCSGG